MKKENENKKRRIDFKEQTPEIFLTPTEEDLLYEKAFLSYEKDSDSEYARNTTTWD